MNSPYQGWRRLIGAARYSWQGLRAAWRSEAAFRQEIWALVGLVPLAGWLAQSVLQFVLLVGVWLWVMVVELLNSAIETVVDRIDPDYHPMAGRAKDMGSAAVLASIVIATMVWIAMIWENWT